MLKTYRQQHQSAADGGSRSVQEKPSSQSKLSGSPNWQTNLVASHFSDTSFTPDIEQKSEAYNKSSFSFCVKDASKLHPARAG